MPASAGEVTVEAVVLSGELSRNVRVTLFTVDDTAIGMNNLILLPIHDTVLNWT